MLNKKKTNKINALLYVVEWMDRTARPHRKNKNNNKKKCLNKSARIKSVNVWCIVIASVNRSGFGILNQNSHYSVRMRRNKNRNSRKQATNEEDAICVRDM